MTPDVSDPAAPQVDHLHVYRDAKHKLRWSFVATNGPILADSGQGYSRLDDLRHAWSILNRRPIPTGTVEVVDCPRHAHDPFMSNPCMVYEIVRGDDVADPADGDQSPPGGENDPTARPVTGGHR